MKLKINKEKHNKAKGIRLNLPNKVRLAIVGILVIILLFSIISLANAYQKSTTTQKTISALEYNQVGNYNYIAYINESLLYEGKETLMPGDGTIFRNITKNINASLLYRLSTNKYSNISGTYTITAQITTENWNKTYTIVNETPVNSNGTYAIFSEQFPIDYLFYENITSQIEEETEIDVNNPTLLIQADIILFIEADDEIIYKTLNPSLSVTLDQEIIEIEFGEDNEDSGKGTPIIEETTNQKVIEERNTWTIYLIISLVILILSAALTKSDEYLTTTGKANKKIMKKYKEWIVDVDKEPMKADSEILQVNSIEDLIKISEELGKPIFHYLTDQDNHHYYVLDGSITYEYKISSLLQVQKTKIAKCPDCETKIEYKGIPGETVHVICPKCKREGNVKI